MAADSTGINEPTHSVGGPIERVVSGAFRSRCDGVRGSVEPIFIEELGELPAVLAQILRADDVVLTLGAGSIGGIAPSLPKVLAVRAPVGVQK